MDNKFDIPVCIFIFKRYKTVLQILDKLRKIKPQKIYLIGDGPRNNEELAIVNECREVIEDAIDWECIIEKDYADINRGVYENIGNGARRVFLKEKCAIFLEDDNLPEISFFQYCKELLERYKEEDQVVWITGTNYLSQYHCDYDYVFTRHLLPCGWASWSHKFLKYYDGNLDSLKNLQKKNQFFSSYKDRILAKQQWHSINTTKRKMEMNKPVSWDFQMCFSIRSNGLVGISPKNNQIKNIGVDADSTHGGTNMNIEMTKRFCGVDSYSLEFPLRHPIEIAVDEKYEELVSDIIKWPLKTQIKYRLCYLIKPFLGMKKYDSMSEKIIEWSRKYRSNGKN